MLVRKALMDPEIDSVTALLSSEAAADNVTQLANSLAWEVSRSGEGEEIQLSIKKKSPSAALPLAPDKPADIRHLAALKSIILLDSQFLGQGNDELGRVLMRAFVKTIAQLDPKPSEIFFLNSAVKLTTEGSDLLDDLQLLQQQNISLRSCGTCLDYFRLKDKLLAGTVCSMFDIVQALLAADKVIRA